MSTLKPFNLEAAKAGKPFCRSPARDRSGGIVTQPEVKYHFVGVRSNGDIVYEISYEDEQHTRKYLVNQHPDDLRMIVEPKIYKGLLVLNKECRTVSITNPAVLTDTQYNRDYIRSRPFLIILKEFEVEYEGD